VRYAVLSDVHGNMQAMRAVADSLRSTSLDAAVCLGDVVGYGADPGEVVAAVRDLCEVVVVGNHDAAAASDDHGFSFNEWAREAILWTRGELTAEQRSYLAALPLEAAHEGALLVHSSPSNPAAWPYVVARRHARIAFKAFDERLCFVGHTHEPAFYVWDGRDARVGELPKLTMEDGSRYIVNVGSVGQPRDGDPRAAYGVVDTEVGTVEIRRVEYDAELAGRRIVEAGLPVFLAERLTHGN
jgi:diadenosine tetraphosphatase ApaH/serine/threonine PP2A family protein phosphatase